MHDSIKEDDIFEINDFTAVTEWEKFVHCLEDCLGQSRYQKSPPIYPKNILSFSWFDSESDNVSYASTHFRLLRRTLTCNGEDWDQPDLCENGDESTVHLPITYQHNHVFQSTFDIPSTNALPARAFGLTDYIFLQPSTTHDSVHSEGKREMIRSALQLAMNTVSLQIPVLLLFDDAQRQLYVGTCACKSSCVDYNSVHLRSAPKQCEHLTGLSEAFKEKVRPNNGTVNTRVTVRIAYDKHFLPEDDEFDFSPAEMKKETERYFQEEFQDAPEDAVIPLEHPIIYSSATHPHRVAPLPFGLESQPVKTLRMFAIWPTMPEDMIIDNGAYSDLNPTTAPRIACNVAFDVGAQTMMCNYLQSFLKLQKAHLMVSDILDDQSGENVEIKYQALGRLTAQSIPPSLSSRALSSSSTRPMSERVVESIIQSIGVNSHSQTDSTFKNVKAYGTKPTAPLRRLANAMCILHSGPHGLSAMLQLWAAYIQMFADHWHHAKLIDGFDTDAKPDHKTSLLQQKMDMLQFCIVTKKRREEEITISDDEEFYDANDEKQSVAPEGRQGLFNNLTLIDYPNIQMYAPKTQEAGPMTEDMLDEWVAQMHSDSGDAEQVGSSVYANTLLSDMQAFKAANPKASLADFVRWHSPRDWIENDEGGQLSSRMESGLWHDTWKMAGPVPVSRQTRLFNESSIANQILQWLRKLTVRDISHMMMPLLLTSALQQISDEGNDAALLVGQKLSATIAQLEGLTNQNVNNTIDLYEDYKSILKEIAWMETALSQYRALCSHLNTANQLHSGGKVSRAEMHRFAIDLMTNDNDTPVPGALTSPIGTVLDSLFVKKRDSTSKPAYGQPSQKEYILTMNTAVPYKHSRRCPQRLYACIQPGKQFRLNLATCYDTTFI